MLTVSLHLATKSAALISNKSHSIKSFSLSALVLVPNLYKEKTSQKEDKTIYIYIYMLEVQLVMSINPTAVTMSVEGTPNLRWRQKERV